MFYFQNAVLNENKGFTIYLQCLCPLGFKIHTDFSSIAVSTATDRIAPWCSSSMLDWRKGLLKHIPAPLATFPHLPSALAPIKPMSQSRSSAAKLNTKGMLFPLLAQQFPVLVQLLVKRRGQKNPTGFEECRMRVFSSNSSIFQMWCMNHHHQPGENPRGGCWCNSEDKVCASEGRNPCGPTASGFIRCWVKTTTPLPYMELFVVLLSSLTVKL